MPLFFGKEREKRILLAESRFFGELSRGRVSSATRRVKELEEWKWVKGIRSKCRERRGRNTKSRDYGAAFPVRWNRSSFLSRGEKFSGFSRGPLFVFGAGGPGQA